MIESITVDNFRSIEHAEVALGRVTLVTGPNRGGKSSLAAAIEFALTGRPAFVNDAGIGLDHLVRRGAKKASVTVRAGHIDGSRSIPARDSAALDQQLASLVGSRTMAQACLRARHFLSLAAEQQQALLYQALGVDLSDSAYVAAINRHSAGLGDFVRPHLPSARKAKGGPSAYAREQRRIANATIKQTRTDIDALSRNIPDVAPVAGPDNVAEELRSTQARIATIEAQRSVGRQGVQSAITAWERTRQQMLRAESDVASAEKEHAAIEASLANGLSQWGEITQEDVAQAVASKSDAEQMLVEARARQNAAVQALTDASGTTVCPAWPIVRDGWVTLTEIERRGEDCPGRSQHRERLQRLQEEVQAAQAAVSQAESDVATAEEARYNADYRCGLLRTYRVRLRSQSDSLCEARQRLFSLGELPERPVEPVEGPNPELDSLLQRLSELEAARAEAQRASQAEAVRAERLRQVEGLRQRLVAQEQDAARWDLLVSLLASSGVQAELSVQPVAAFAAEVDALCREWFSLAFRLQNDPEKGTWACEGWNLLHSDPPESGPWVPLSMGFGCGNETVLAGAVLQVELARRAGFPIVILDELGLDAEWRPQLVGYLLEQDVQSVVLQPANDRDDSGNLVRPDVHQDGLAIYWAENGALTCLADGVAGSTEPARAAA